MPENEKELEQEVEKVLEEYEINPNTIRYHSSIKRFFRAFTPKIVGTSSLLATSGIALAAIIGGAVTGGLGLVPAAIAGSVAGAATVASGVATISLGVDAATVSRVRFKNLGVEDTRAIVEKMESEAYDYTQKLAELEQSGQKRIQLKDGNYYTARQLKRLIQGYEKEAYHGVKYLMKKAEENTDQIEKLRKTRNISEAQKKQQAKLWTELEMIGECVRSITSKRNDVNPYKNLIISALHKGCLIGRNDRENGEIRKHKIYGKINLTEELYHKMYEKELLEQNPPKQEVETPKPTREEKKAEKTRTLKKQIRELEAQNEALEAQNQRTQARYESAVKRAVGKRAEARYFREEKEKVEDALAGNIMASHKEDQMNKRFIQSVIEKLGSVEEENEVLEAQVEESARESLKYQTRYEKAVKRNVRFREDNRDLENARDSAIDELYETEDKLKRTQDKHERATKHVATQVQRTRDAEYQVKSAETKLGALEDEVRAQISARKQAEANVTREIGKRKAAETRIEALEGEARAQVNARQSAEQTAEREKGIRVATESKLNSANQTINEQNIRINEFVMAQQENIDTIVGLEVENDKLKQENGYWQSRAEDAEDTVRVVYGTTEALERSITKIQEELDSINSDKTKNLEKANVARQIKATARKIAEIWNHVKIAQSEDAKKFEESTDIVIQALDTAVDKYNTAKERGDVETVKQVRDELQEVYDTQRRVDKEHTWPPYIKDTKKVIPGTPVPNSPQDENYYLK